MRRIEKTIFISYRRRDDSWALAIFGDLTNHGYDVFIDYDSIASGNFETAILENIRARAHFLVLLTPTALERCADPKDWMRREIEAALDSRRNIVPLMLEGFDFSRPDIAGQLTDRLAALNEYNGVEIPKARFFSSEMERLRNKFLNVPIDAVLHPASYSAQQIAKEQKGKAAAALEDEQSKLDTKTELQALGDRLSASGDPSAPTPAPPPLVPDLAAPADHAPSAHQPNANPQASGADQSVASDVVPIEWPDRKPPAANPAPPFPSLKQCRAVISASKRRGLAAISELPALLEPECPELAEILESSAITISLEIFDRRDAESIALQTDLKHGANRAVLCLLLAGVTSAVILAMAVTAGAVEGPVAEAVKDAAGRGFEDLSPGGLIITLSKFNITLLLGLLTLAFGAGAIYFNFVARDQSRFSRWRASRSDAEMARQAVFTTMASAAGGKSAKTALFGLTVVMRDLLEDQRAYLAKAAQRHRKSSEISSRWAGLAGALAFIGGSGAIVASQGGASWANWIIVVAVFGTAIGAFANQDAFSTDRAYADRYEGMLVALDGFRGRTDDIARQIANGEPKALTVFTGAITDLLASEFKQWQEGSAQANAGIDKLDEQLSQLGKPKGADVAAN